MQPQPDLTIIINNYNYLRFLPGCFDSLLQQTDLNFEILIVDDGSSDGSWDYISSLPTNVVKLRTNRLNQASACLHAAQYAKGRFIHFLDADDYLSPSFVLSVRPHLSEGVSNIQVQMLPVDKTGRPLGTPFPAFSEGTTTAIRKSILQHGIYGAPPTSGNVFSRELLDQIISINYETAIDGVTILYSPFVGKVVQLSQPLAHYRIHENNKSRHPKQFRTEAARFVARLDHLKELIGTASFPTTDFTEFSFYIDRSALASVRESGRLSPGAMLRYIYKISRSQCYTKRGPLLVWAALSCLAPSSIREAALERAPIPGRH